MFRIAIRGVTRANTIVTTLSLDEPMFDVAPWHNFNAAGWMGTTVLDEEGRRIRGVYDRS